MTIKFVYLTGISILIGLLANAQIIKSDFVGNLNIGSDLEQGIYINYDDPIMNNQWNLSHEDNYTSGSSPLVTMSLYYPGYVGSEELRGLELNKLGSGSRVSVYSLTDGNIYAGKPYYLSFLVNIKSATFASGSNSPAYFDFISFADNYQGSAPIGRIYLGKSYASGSNIVFGIKEDYTDNMVVTGFDQYETNTTYLFVLKYDPTEGGDDMKLYINPSISAEEPVSATLSRSKSTSISGIKAIFIKQTVANNLVISGLRFSDTWAGAIGYSGNSTNKMKTPVITSPLKYKDYVDSEKGYGIQLNKLDTTVNYPSVYSLTASKTEYFQDAYYLTFLLKVDKDFLEDRASKFIYFSPNYNGTRGRGRIYFYGIDNSSGKYRLGLKDNENDDSTNFPINYTMDELVADSTYLIVLKTNLAESGEDLQLFINPEISNDEPESSAVSCERTFVNPLTFIRGLCVNQSDVANINISGIRLTDNFASALGYSDPVSSKLNNKLANYKIYPNPCDNRIYLSYPGLDNVNISISDLQGRLLKTQKVNSCEPINTTDLSSGYYLLNIIDSKSVTQKMKFIKR